MSFLRLKSQRPQQIQEHRLAKASAWSSAWTACHSYTCGKHDIYGFCHAPVAETRCQANHALPIGCRHHITRFHYGGRR